MSGPQTWGPIAPPIPGALARAARLDPASPVTVYRMGPSYTGDGTPGVGSDLAVGNGPELDDALRAMGF